MSLPRLVFLLGEDTEGPAGLMQDLEHGPRQHDFRTRLRDCGVTHATVTSPAELETALLHALTVLAPPPTTTETGSQTDPGGEPVLGVELRAAYLAALTRRYRLLDLATLTPEAHDEHLPVLLAQVFIPQQVRATPPPVELPRELWRRLVESGDLARDELPAELDRELLTRARQAHLEQPPQPVLQVLTGPQQRLVALLGDPGAGKSSLLRYLALTLAGGDLPAELAGWAGWLPVLVELRGYADPTWRTGRWADGTLLDYLDYLHTHEGVGLPRAVLDHHLRDDGRAVVMFDGLDELFDPAHRDATARRIAAFAAQYPRVRVIATSRPVGYRRAVLDGAGFGLHALQDLDRDQIATFTHTWYALAYRGNPTDAAARANRLLAAIDRSPSVADLASNPLLLTILAVIGRRRELPRERHRVYQHAVEVLVQHWEVNRALHDTRVQLDYLDETDKRALLRRIARRMQAGPGGIAGNRLPRPELLAEIRDYLAQQHQLPPEQAASVAAAIVEQLRERNFILARFGPGLYGFVHRVFLEYCCADEITHRVKETQELSVEDLATHVFGDHATDPAWQEVLLLIAGMIHEKFLARVLNHLLDAADTPIGRIGRYAGQHLVLALRCVAEARTTTAFDTQGLRLTRALITLLIAASYEVVAERWLRPAALTSVLAAVAQLEDFGSRLPGREAYLEWFSRPLPPTVASGFGLDLTQALCQIAVALCPDREDLRILLSDRITGYHNWTVRRGVVWALAQGWPDEQTRSLLTDCIIDDDSNYVREAVVLALAQSWPDKLTRILLIDRTTAKDLPVRRAAMQALGQGWPDKRTRTLLKGAITDRLVQEAAMNALAQGWPDERTRTLLERAATDSYGDVGQAALWALAESWPDEQTGTWLADRTTDKDWRIRQAAVQALGQGWPDERTRTLVTDRTTDPDEDVRQAAVQALAQGWPDERTRTWLIDRATTDPFGDVGEAALWALAEGWPDECTRALLTERTTDQNHDVGEAALWALAEGWPDECTRALLTERATDKNGLVRHAAVQALGRGWPDEQTRALLERAATDPDASVRRTAVWALAQGWPDEHTRTLLIGLTADDSEGVRGDAVHALVIGWPGERLSR